MSNLYFIGLFVVASLAHSFITLGDKSIRTLWVRAIFHSLMAFLLTTTPIYLLSALYLVLLMIDGTEIGNYYMEKNRKQEAENPSSGQEQ